MTTTDPVAKIREESRKHGVRWTTQRETAVRIILNSNGHHTVEDYHRLIHAQDPSISPATVYRTVRLLVELGAIDKRHFTDGSASFESALDRSHHDHLVCTKCGEITEFYDDRIEKLQDDMAAAYGFVLSHHRMELYGICKKCRAA